MIAESIESAPKYRAPIVSFLLSVPVQAIGFALGLLLSKFIPEPIILVIVQAAAAYALSRWLRLSKVWQYFNFALWPLLLILFQFQLSQTLLGILLILGLLIYLPTFWTKVPYYPTSDQTYEVLLSLLPEKGHFSFIDLGCGFGHLLDYLAKRRPEGSFVGVEIGPLPFLLAKLRFLVTGQKKVKIRFQDFWSLSLAEFDVVYAFLAPPPMARLWEKAKSEMRPGSTFITNSFEVPEKASEKREIGDKRDCVLYIHRR